MNSIKPSKYIKTWRNLQHEHITVWLDENLEVTKRIVLTEDEFTMLGSMLNDIAQAQE